MFVLLFLVFVLPSLLFFTFVLLPLLLSVLLLLLLMIIFGSFFSVLLATFVSGALLFLF